MSELNVYSEADRIQLSLVHVLPWLFHKFGICGSAVEWITLFLFDQSQQIYYK